MPLIIPSPEAKERFKVPEIEALLHYWDEKRGYDIMPDRRAIKPEEISPLIPRMLIHHWRPSGQLIVDFIGGALVTEGVFDLTGVDFFEVITPKSKDWLSDCLGILNTRPAGAMIDNRVFYNKDPAVDYAALTLPLKGGAQGEFYTISVDVPLTREHTLLGPDLFATGYELGAAWFIDIGAGCPDPFIREGWPIEKLGS